MYTLTVDQSADYHALRQAPGAFHPSAYEAPFGFTGRVSFLTADQLVYALTLLPENPLIGAKP